MPFISLKQIAILHSENLQKELCGTRKINAFFFSEALEQGGCKGRSIGSDAENIGLLVPFNVWTILCYSKHLLRNLRK